MAESVGLTIQVKSNRLPVLAAAARKGAARAFTTNRQPALADMQRRTPVDTGALRDSEDVTTTETEMRWTAGTNHAVYVHQGTHRMPARPFMRQSVEFMAPQIAADIAAEIGSALR